MMVQISPEAMTVLRRSLDLARLDPSKIGIRLHVVRSLGRGMDVQLEFVEEAHEGDIAVDKDGLQIFIDPNLTESIPDAVVTVEQPHERIVVRPA